MVFFEHTTVLIEGGCTDTFQLTTGQGRLEQVRCIQRTARCGARTNDGVNFVDEQNPIGIILHLFEYCFKTLLKVAAILGAGQ